jgi:hypothetical protein
MILDSPHHAVCAQQLENAFGGGGAGSAVLASMVKANLFAYRPYSSWARDIPESAFLDNVGAKDIIVTAPNAAALFCMRRLKLPEPPAPEVCCFAHAFVVSDTAVGFSVPCFKAGLCSCVHALKLLMVPSFRCR